MSFFPQGNNFCYVLYGREVWSPIKGEEDIAEGV
jgi:hypothetical protein